MNTFYLIILIGALALTSCSPQEVIEANPPINEYHSVVEESDKKCHAIPKQDTILINLVSGASESNHEFTVDRCFLANEDKENIIIYKDGAIVFDKTVEEIRIGTKLYVTLCGNLTLLSWGGVDPDELGNLFDYETYSLIGEQTVIDSGRSNNILSLNSQCQLSAPPQK